MHIIEIEIFENRMVKCENITAGTTGENEATKLKFIIPEMYKDFYKYLDILKKDGTKTQTVVGDTESKIFYYSLPYSLTNDDELILQLVLKKENTVFKSNMFSLYFSQSLEGTQILIGDYQDTIEFLMENKAERKEVDALNIKVNNKTDRQEYYDLNDKLNRDISFKVDITDFENYKSQNQVNVSRKVDKISGKGLSTEDYTTYDKNKLQALPTLNELNDILDGKIDQHELQEIRDEVHDEKIIRETLSVEINDHQGRINNLEADIGDIDSALNELHNYAQAKIGGGA